MTTLKLIRGGEEVYSASYEYDANGNRTKSVSNAFDRFATSGLNS